MASLTHAIRAFQSGGLSHNDFLAQIDRVLAVDQANPEQLFEILGEEHTKVPLPPDVYAEVHRRIEHRAGTERSSSSDPTLFVLDPEDSLKPTEVSSPEAGSGDKVLEGADRMKGVGDTLNNRFRLEECLGFGGMGTVYKALDLRKLEASDRNPYIAIKVLNVQFRGHPKSLIALQREAKKAQALAHPNIVTVYDFDRDGTTVFLTMEFLSGNPLSRTLRAPGFSGMPYGEALPIISGMAKALAYAHERGFVHCDFKPANVFLTDSGQVKVIDFGIARVFQKSEEESEATVFDAGSLGGLTPAYASPEMLEHREPDPRDDVYALACISYELLTGVHPFKRLPATQARGAGMKPQAPKNLPRRQWRALKTALSFERETRTPSVSRFVAELIGQRPPAVSIALWTSGLMVAAAVVATVVSYYWESLSERSAKQEVAEATPPVDAAPKVELKPEVKVVPKPEVKVEPKPEPKLSLSAVSPILAAVPCSAFVASVDDHALRVQGYVPEKFGIARLKGALTSVPGVKSLNADVQQVGDDKCSVMQALGPYWAKNRQSGGNASIHIRTKDASATLTEGESLIADIKTPGYDSFVNVDYYVLDGNVVHLLPSPRAKANQAPPNYSATIGTLGGWVISKPFGSELIVLMVTPEPLFDGVRREYESKSEYLQAVEKRLSQMTAKYGPDRIAVDIVQITTKAR